MSERFDGLRYPVHKHRGTDTEFKLIFPELFRYEEFEKYGYDKVDGKWKKSSRLPYRNQVIRYVAFLYDPASELVEEFENFTERREAAAIEAGFNRDPKTDEWPEFVKDLFTYKHEDFVHLTIKFLKIFHNDLWMEICALEVELDRNMGYRWSGVTGTSGQIDANALEKSQKLRDHCDDIRKRLKACYKEFFKGDEGLKDRFDELEMVTPENMERVLSYV
jgi:hypothetical protein